MIGIRKQTDWYLNKSKELGKKNVEIIVPILAYKMAEAVYFISVFKAIVSVCEEIKFKYEQWI